MVVKYFIECTVVLIQQVDNIKEYNDAYFPQSEWITYVIITTTYILHVINTHTIVLDLQPAVYTSVIDLVVLWQYYTKTSESHPRKVELMYMHKNATTTMGILHTTMKLVNTTIKLPYHIDVFTSQGGGLVKYLK